MDDTNAPAENSPALWPDSHLSTSLSTELRTRMVSLGWSPDNIAKDGTARHLARSVMQAMVRERQERLRHALNKLDDNAGSDAPRHESESRAAWSTLWECPAEIELLRDAADR